MKNTVQRYRLFPYRQETAKKKGVEKALFMLLLHLFSQVAIKLLTAVDKTSYSTYRTNPLRYSPSG